MNLPALLPVQPETECLCEECLRGLIEGRVEGQGLKVEG